MEGLVNDEEDMYAWLSKFTLKSILLPKRKLNLEKKVLDKNLENDLKGRQIVNSLQRHDVLEWEVEVKYDEFISTS